MTTQFHSPPRRPCNSGAPCNGYCKQLSEPTPSMVPFYCPKSTSPTGFTVCGYIGVTFSSWASRYHRPMESPPWSRSRSPCRWGGSSPPHTSPFLPRQPATWLITRFAPATSPRAIRFIGWRRWPPHLRQIPLHLPVWAGQPGPCPITPRSARPSQLSTSTSTIFF